MKIKQSKAKQSKAKQSKAKQEPECKKHKWIPLAGNDKGKKVPTALFTCLKCGDLKVGTHTIKISRYRMDMGELPMNSIAGIKLMNQPSADLTASGLIMTATVDTNAQGIGAPLYMAANGHLITADADTSATSPCVALAMETGTGSKKVLVHGVLRVDAWNWTTGPGDASLIYVSTDVGTLTQGTSSFFTNNIVQPVGWALTADSIYFSPTMMYVTSSATPWYGERGVVAGAGGYGSGEPNTISYITIATPSNTTDFGDLTSSRYIGGACSNSTRGVFGGGDINSVGQNTIDYITIATTGDAIDFGDLTVARWFVSACSNGTRGVFGLSESAANVIDYITIATAGNAVDFGDLTVGRYATGTCSSLTRGIFAGGYGPTNVIDYITIATTGNAIDFGDLTVARYGSGGCSSSTRGIFGGGNTTSRVNTIDYITITTTGDATDFGDLTVAREYLAACSNGTRGVFITGLDASANNNTIDYVTIATTGDATDFGDIAVPGRYPSACSGN